VQYFPAMPIDRYTAFLAAKQYSASERLLLFPLGALAIWFAIKGVSTGEVPLKFSTLRRSNGKLLFWFGIVMNLVLGVMCLLGFFFGMEIWKWKRKSSREFGSCCLHQNVNCICRLQNLA
jgi:hypothetical protein